MYLTVTWLTKCTQWEYIKFNLNYSYCIYWSNPNLNSFHTSTSPISESLLWVKSKLGSGRSLDCEVSCSSSTALALLLGSRCPKMTLNTASSAAEVSPRALVDGAYRFELALELLATILSLEAWPTGVSCEGWWQGASNRLFDEEFPARSVDTARLSQAVRTNVSSALVFGALDDCRTDSLSSSDTDEALNKMKGRHIKYSFTKLMTIYM